MSQPSERLTPAFVPLGIAGGEGTSGESLHKASPHLHTECSRRSMKMLRHSVSVASIRAACQVWKQSVDVHLRARRPRCDSRCLDARDNLYRAAKVLEKNSIRRTPRPGYGACALQCTCIRVSGPDCGEHGLRTCGAVPQKIPGECRRSGVGLAAPLMVRNHFNHNETAALRQVARLVMPLTSPEDP
jgi:hypothetical protein